MPVLSLTSNTAESVLHPPMGEVAAMCLVGISIVFSVLAIIFFSMKIMSAILANKGGQKVTVVSPFACTVESLVEGPRTNEDDVVAVVTTDDGSTEEILAPLSGSISYCVREGAKVKKGQKLFVVR